TCGPDDVDPWCVRELLVGNEARPIHKLKGGDASEPEDSAALVRYVVTRSALAIEAIAHHRRLVLLGEPGSGKSTVLRYLALLLARRLRGDAVTIPGWPDDETPIPILCPLGQVAAALARQGDNAYAALRE